MFWRFSMRLSLYPHLENLTDMKPVVVDPSIGFEQLINVDSSAGFVSSSRLNVASGGSPAASLAISMKDSLRRMPRIRNQEPVSISRHVG